MSRVAPAIALTGSERRELQRIARAAGTSARRMVDRAQFVLHAAAGKSNQEIAVALNVRATTVGKWRSRFARERLAGLRDEPRPGSPRTYDEKTEQRILAMLATPPPEGYGSWTGGLFAQVLSDVSDDQIWRVLRQCAIMAMFA
jgi:transposase